MLRLAVFICQPASPAAGLFTVSPSSASRRQDFAYLLTDEYEQEGHGRRKSIAGAVRRGLTPSDSESLTSWTSSTLGSAPSWTFWKLTLRV